MRLSEAIRAGAKLGPQAFGSLEEERRPWWRIFWPFASTQKAVCALGGALKIGDCGSREVAADQGEPFRGKKDPKAKMATVVIVPGEWESVWYAPATCPQYCGKRSHISMMIAHLNDDHRWTREQIADWVGRVEALEELTDQVEADSAARVAAESEEWPEQIEVGPND